MLLQDTVVYIGISREHVLQVGVADTAVKLTAEGLS